MKKIYTLALSGLMLISASSLAQNVYTAVRSGDWHNTDVVNHPENTIWLPVEPPMNCAHCTINLNITGGGTINLNAHVVLSANSQLNIGDGNAANAVAVNVANSGVNARLVTTLATDTSKSNSISIVNDNTQTLVKVGAGSSFTPAPNTGDAGDMDGIFSVSGFPGTETFSKTVGFAPNVIVVTSSGMSVLTSQGPEFPFLVGVNTLNPTGTLPVLLTGFTATLNGGVVDLDWTTALEVNSDHFVVQRSGNAGAGWEPVGTIAAHGNSAIVLNYSFTDIDPVQGTAEYRLQMVDKDGAYKFSEVKTIRMGTITSVSLYPNPARDFVNVTLGKASGFTLIRFYNQGGQLLQEKSTNNAGGNVIALPVSGYPEGNYIVVVTGADGSRQANKVVITK